MTQAFTVHVTFQKLYVTISKMQKMLFSLLKNNNTKQINLMHYMFLISFLY